MIRYISKRILIMIPTLIFVVFVAFMILTATPSNPGRMLLGPTATPEQVDAVNRSFGLDKPPLVRFAEYCTKLLHGDFGTSYRSQRAVTLILLPKFPRTLQIAVLAVVTSALVGIPFGVLSAVKQNTLADHATTVSALFFGSVPSFWLGLMAMLLFSLKLGWLPSSGVGTWRHLVMPVATLALPSAAYLSRIMRATMLEAVNQDYIRTAKAKGAPTRRQIFGHALRNALLPVVSQLGMSFASLLGGALITESAVPPPGRKESSPCSTRRASRASTTGAIPTSSQEGRGRGSESPAPSRSTPLSSCATSPSPPWTSRSRRRSSTCWPTSRNS